MACVVSNNPVSGRSLCKRLVEILHLEGQQVTSVTVRFAMREVVSATVERLLSKEEAAQVVELLETVTPVIVYKDANESKDP